jgi:hypothetical protein
LADALCVLSEPLLPAGVFELEGEFGGKPVDLSHLDDRVILLKASQEAATLVSKGGPFGPIR